MNLLVVATTRMWVADHLAGNTTVPVVHDHGLDAPTLPASLRPAWWTPTEHAARLRAAGIRFAPQAPGARWLADLDPALTGRSIWAGTLTDLRTGGPARGYVKLAEAKHPDALAAWHLDTRRFAADVALPGTTAVQVADTHLALAAEYRFFVADRQITGGSWYLAGGHTWDPDHAPDIVDLDSATAFARDVVATLSDQQPAGYVLDVAVTTTGRWLVLEGNPAWSANPYGTGPDAVVDSVICAFTAPGWAWDPDPYLVGYAARRRPLIRCSPAWLPRLDVPPPSSPTPDTLDKDPSMTDTPATSPEAGAADETGQPPTPEARPRRELKRRSSAFDPPPPGNVYHIPYL